ncbi:zinc finger CCCH domain-containing protein 55-like isoform X1 [Rhodamnia argentea]|uniref:Zinc finger CCCH domain-containing protein 55-like isoform X1 n=1 Tax=Rhodamnia argentea TaxID=178133 RepID=A0A8B8NJ85_9MYRT|nr:zinc finger CCCH domain-containing protein 55-like isoform X1 [Rhodamnia argentea]
MDANEATSIVLSKIRGIDPENASKIMGYLLIQDLTEKDLIRLAFGPETLLHSLILKAKNQMGLSSSALPAQSANAPHHTLAPTISIPTNPATANAHGLPQSSPRITPRGDYEVGKGPFSGFAGNVVRQNSSPSLPFESARSGSYFASLNGSSCSVNTGGASDFMEENSQLGDYFAFLNDSSKSGDVYEMGYNADTHLHRRSYSESDVGFGCGGEEACFGGGYRQCLYYTRGFCKNGSNCKFLHGDDFEGSANFVGSPSNFDAEEMMRLKVAHQQRLAAASQFLPGISPTSHGKYMALLMQQHNETQRMGVPGVAMGDEFYKYGRYQVERNEYLAMGLAEKANSASRQIYLTFPADSTFKDEDVSDYFSNYGPVQDVRIPYQQKRMFGFVTFVYPGTVKLILTKGNPHFICNSRVLVKPYKEKGKIPEKRQQHQQQLFERGEFSSCSSHSLLDSGEPYDHLGERTTRSRVFHNPQEMVIRRKLEEQANLQQAIELQSRRLMNLQLPDLKDDGIYHHLRSFSVGSPVSPPIHPHTQINHKVVMPSDATNHENAEDCRNGPAATISVIAATGEQQLHYDVNAACAQDIGSGEGKSESSKLTRGDSRGSLENILPDSPFASPTKFSGDHIPDFSRLADETDFAESSEIPDNNVSLTMSSGDGPSQ